MALVHPAWRHCYWYILWARKERRTFYDQGNCVVHFLVFTSTFYDQGNCAVVPIPQCWLNGFIRPVLKHGPRRESNLCASWCKTMWALNPHAKWKCQLVSLRTDDRPRSSGRVVSTSVEVRTRKHGELRIGMAKSGETLMEARSENRAKLVR